MVVEFCPSGQIGRFTGYYYTSSMLAQSITPIALGALMLIPGFGFAQLPVYALCCMVLSFLAFFFVKGLKPKKENIKTGIEALGESDD
jgi:hypothetical protein